MREASARFIWYKIWLVTAFVMLLAVACVYTLWHMGHVAQLERQAQKLSQYYLDTQVYSPAFGAYTPVQSLPLNTPALTRFLDQHLALPADAVLQMHTPAYGQVALDVVHPLPARLASPPVVLPVVAGCLILAGLLSWLLARHVYTPWVRRAATQQQVVDDQTIALQRLETALDGLPLPLFWLDQAGDVARANTLAKELLADDAVDFAAQLKQSWQAGRSQLTSAGQHYQLLLTVLPGNTYLLALVENTSQQLFFETLDHIRHYAISANPGLPPVPPMACTHEQSRLLGGFIGMAATWHQFSAELGQVMEALQQGNTSQRVIGAYYGTLNRLKHKANMLVHELQGQMAHVNGAMAAAGVDMPPSNGNASDNCFVTFQQAMAALAKAQPATPAPNVNLRHDKMLYDMLYRDKYISANAPAFPLAHLVKPFVDQLDDMAFQANIVAFNAAIAKAHNPSAGAEAAAEEAAIIASKLSDLARVAPRYLYITVKQHEQRQSRLKQLTKLLERRADSRPVPVKQPMLA